MKTNAAVFVGILVGMGGAIVVGSLTGLYHGAYGSAFSVVYALLFCALLATAFGWMGKKKQ